MSGKQPEFNPCEKRGRGPYAPRYSYTSPSNMSHHIPEFGQWMDERYYRLEIIQSPTRGRTCGFGDKDRRPIAPALIAKLVATDTDGSPVAPENIDPSFFLVMVDLWSENGEEERTRVLNNTPREKVQRDRKRQATHDTRPEPASSSAASAPPQTHDLAAYTGLFSPVETTSGLSGSGSSTLHGGSHYASPIGASPGACSSQQNPIPTSSWGVAGSSQYPVQPLPPSNAALLYSAQGMPHLGLGYAIHSPPSNAPQVPMDPQFPIGASQGMPTAGQAFPYGPTAGAFQLGPSVHPSGQYAQIDPSEVYATLIGTSVATGAHIKDDQGQTNILFVFGDLSVRTEGTFRLRLRLSNIGQFNPTDGRAWTINTGTSHILAQAFSEPFQVYNPKNFPGVPAITELSKAVGIQGQKIPKRTKPTTSGGASRSGPSKKRKLRRDEESDGEWNDGDSLHDD